MTRITAHEPTFYQDVGELQKIKANPDQRAALETVANQFEVNFLQSVLKHMRAASDALQDDEDKLIRGNELYRDMYDSQLSMSLVKRGGFGIAEQMVRQLDTGLKNSTQVVAPNEEPVAALQQPLTHPVRNES